VIEVLPFALVTVCATADEAAIALMRAMIRSLVVFI
jgi:hypothetical protein